MASRKKKAKTIKPKKKAAAKKLKKVAKKAKPAPKKAKAKAKKPAAKKPAAAKGTVNKPLVDRVLKAAEVEGLMRRLPPPVQPVMKTLRKIVLDSAPEAVEFLQKDAPAYFAQGVFARIEPQESEVLVKFLRGSYLPSAEGLSGDGETRTLALSSVEELKSSVLKKLVREAVMLNLSTVSTDPDAPRA